MPIESMLIARSPPRVTGFKTWSRLAPKEREAALLKAADRLEQVGRERSCLIPLIDESGSTITKARFEIRYSSICSARPRARPAACTATLLERSAATHVDGVSRAGRRRRCRLAV